MEFQLTSALFAVRPRVLPEGEALLPAILAAFLVSFVMTVRAEVTLPAVLASHMVVQRDLPVHVWGWAPAGESVTVSFRGNSRTRLTDRRGKWSVFLPQAPPGVPSN